MCRALVGECRLETGSQKVAELIILSLGWGVQSFTLAAMSALGELPPVIALHADTTHETAETYAFAERWTPWLLQHGVQVVTVRADVPQLQEGGAALASGVFIPAFTQARITGKAGKLKRQCTQRWKIQPIRRWVRAELQRRKLKPRPGGVEMWLGISLDEAERAKPSRVKYIHTRWPLLERRMRREDCERWLLAHGLEVPTKSACVFCPFRSARNWRALASEDWQKAVQVDSVIREARPKHLCYLHRDRKPLAIVDLRTPQERGQLDLLLNEQDECSGHCFV